MAWISTVKSRLGGAICTATRFVIRKALQDAAIAIAEKFDIPLDLLLSLVDPATSFILANAGC